MRFGKIKQRPVSGTMFAWLPVRLSADTGEWLHQFKDTGEYAWLEWVTYSVPAADVHQDRVDIVYFPR